MATRLITLTTDFGLTDHFAGVMKGVILSLCPAARIVDICHEVSAYQIAEGGFTIAQAYRFFPPKTVHVIVVDPGVGTARRPLLTEAAGQFFVAPDNGVLSMIYSGEKHKVRAVTASRYFLGNVSRTFHGRDVFAPVAAHLANGVAPSRFGKPVTDYLRLDFDTPVRTGKRVWTGAVLKVDHFGNLITNFRPENFPQVRAGRFVMAAGMERIGRLAQNYAECAPGELFLIEGSSGFLEISLSQASAAKRLGCASGSPLELTVY
jgi:S-adenosylmethionine hydrolase